MALLHVGVNCQTSVGADGQRSVRESHLVKVGLREVAADGAFYLSGIEQQIYPYAAFKDVVMASDVGLSASVLQIDVGCQVVKVQLTVLQCQNAGVGSQTALG